MYILFLGFFGVVLEAPYFGSILWIIMGLIIVIMKYYEREYTSEVVKPQLTSTEEFSNN